MFKMLENVKVRKISEETVFSKNLMNELTAAGVTGDNEET